MIFLKDNPTKFSFSEEQWEHFQERFASWLPEFDIMEGGIGKSLIHRLGLIMFRIAMVLSVLRKWENKDYSDRCVCAATDFFSALRIVDTLKDHAILILDLIPDSDLSNRDKNLKRFLNVLPKEKFPRSFAVKFGKDLGLKERTVDKYLKNLLVLKKLECPEYGWYKKIN